MENTIQNNIKSIQQIQVEMPLVHPFQTSFGVQNSSQSIIIKIEDEDGNIGWGETCVSTEPSYCYETTNTAFHIQKDFLLPKFREYSQSHEIISIPSLLNSWEPIRGHEFAKGGIEAGLWSLKAEQDNVSLGDIYGSEKSNIPTGVSIGIQPSLEALLLRIGKFINLGYKRIKIKIEPGWDTEVIGAIRKEYGDIQLMVDANSAYSLSEKDIKTMQKLDGFNLMMIEQPLSYHDMLDHKKLQEKMTTPICLDESIHSPHDARLAFEFECCRIINIKPGRVGGYYNAITIAKESGKDKIWCGGMLENGIGRVHNLFLQARDEFTIPGDTSGSDRYYEYDIIDPAVCVDDNGFITLPKGKGLGVKVLEDKLDDYKTRSELVIF
ncbi:MAG: o-succinylbenzoate synthase [Candidatus Kariarchaeaceae archaeon]|jgi:O-succinylbenzoate synthase